VPASVLQLTLQMRKELICLATNLTVGVAARGWLAYLRVAAADAAVEGMLVPPSVLQLTLQMRKELICLATNLTVRAAARGWLAAEEKEPPL